MARFEITNNQLLALNADIQKQQNESPAFYFFNKEKIKRFYQQNTMLIKIVDKRKSELAIKYAIHNDLGEPVLEEKEGIQHYTFVNEEAENNYKEELSTILARSVTVEL